MRYTNPRLYFTSPIFYHYITASNVHKFTTFGQLTETVDVISLFTVRRMKKAVRKKG